MFYNVKEENKNPELIKEVLEDTCIKTFLVQYVGEKVEPENNEVTLEHIVEIVSEEFPEFLLPLAEENFVRGYQQALLDVEEGRLAWKEEMTDRQEQSG